MTQSTEWQRIGEIPVDTGRIVLVDPDNAEDVAEQLEEINEHGLTYELITNEHGIPVALVLSTGLGDGTYPVEARFEEAAGSTRIAEVRIRFLPHPVIGYQLP